MIEWLLGFSIVAGVVILFCLVFVPLYLSMRKDDIWRDSPVECFCCAFVVTLVLYASAFAAYALVVKLPIKIGTSILGG